MSKPLTCPSCNRNVSSLIGAPSHPRRSKLPAPKLPAFLCNPCFESADCELLRLEQAARLASHQKAEASSCKHGN